MTHENATAIEWLEAAIDQKTKADQAGISYYFTERENHLAKALAYAQCAVADLQGVYDTCVQANRKGRSDDRAR